MVAGVTTTGLVLLGLVALGGVLSVALGGLFWHRDLKAPAPAAYARLAFASAGWSFSYFAILLAANESTIFVLHRVYSLFTFLVLVAWLEFATEYTGVSARFRGLPRLVVYGFLGGYFLLVLTNPWHHLVYADAPTIASYHGLSVVELDRTTLLRILLSIAYLLVAGGFGLLVRFFFAARNVYRLQTAVILFGGFLVGVTSAVYFGGLLPDRFIDPTPMLFVANSLLIGVALVRYDVFDVVPIAADMLIEEMDDPVIVVDTDGDIVDVNATARVLFEDDPVGRPLAAVSPDIASAVAAGEEVSHRTADCLTTYDPRTTTITDQHGIERGTLVVLRDVTEQVRRQAELERQNDRLEAFASVVSHDLRNPLSVAHAYAQTAIAEEDVAYLEQVLDSLDRMDELIGDLLMLAREGEAVDDVSAVSIADLARRAWNQVETGDATLVVDADATVPADERRLRQLFENLFRNAVEHGGDDVTVTVGALDDGAGFYVADDGPGIPADDRDRVFEHGYSSSADGTGFGLAIVRTIADAHGWAVTATESESGGARFDVTGVAGSTAATHEPSWQPAP